MENILNKHFEVHENPENDIYVNLCYDFLDEIHSKLKEKGWSQKDLAEKMGKSPAEINKIISGLHNVTFKTVAKLSHAFDADLIYTNSSAKSKYGNITHGGSSIIIERNQSEIPTDYNDLTEEGKVISLKIA